MNELTVKIENVKGQLVVSSRVIAEQLGKEHYNVIRDLEKILETSNVRSLIISSTYEVSGQKRKYKEYLLTKDGFTLYMFNIQGYNDFKMSYINRFNQMEQQLQNQFKVPTNFKEALLLAAKQQEEIEKLALENESQKQIIGELKPAKEYLDIILASEDTMTITQIAADYSLSARAMNIILHEQGLIRNVGGQWILYKEHMNKGYTRSETIQVKRKDGTDKVVMNTKWTQKGRLKIHEILTNLGIKANQDREKVA